MELRDYQAPALDAVRASYKHGHKSVVCVAPTGSGKSVMIGHVAKGAIKQGRRVVVIAHRTELVDQLRRTLHLVTGDMVGTIAAGSFGARYPDARIQVASVQTLMSRGLPKADLCILDEAHHYVADDWQSVRRVAPLHLGFTATPQRSDGRGLKAAFTSMVVVAQIPELIERGYLCPVDVVAPRKLLPAGTLAMDPADALRKHGHGKAVVFCRFVDDAVRLADRVGGRVVHGAMGALERQQNLQWFRATTNAVLCNVFVLTEGWDAPEVETCVLARGCSTVGTYLQMVGRVLRPAPGKERATLIDLRGVVHSLGAPDEPRSWTLEGKGLKGTGDDNTALCPICSGVLVDGCCDMCGHRSERAVQRIVNEPMVRYAKKRAESTYERAATLRRWQLEGRARGYRPGWAYAKYRAVYGHAPTEEVKRLAR